MKRLIASAGVLAAGTAAMHAQYSPYFEPGQEGKFWTVSMAVRGFYDDNYLNYPSTGFPAIPTRIFIFPAVTNINMGVTNVIPGRTNIFPGRPRLLPRESFGFELNPSLKFSLPREQTFFQAGYSYWMRYYFDRETDPIDHTHEFTGLVDHRFSERYRMLFNDSFVSAQEPEIVEGAGRARSTFIRTETSVLRNRAKIEFSGLLTELIGAGASYENVWYDYEQETLSGLLNRIEHVVDLSGRWLMDERTTISLGYALGLASYTSDQVIRFGTNAASSADDLVGSDRSSVTHSVYVGLHKQFSPRLTVTGRAGVDATSYEVEQAGSTISPSIDVVGSYEYQPGNRLVLGIRHDRSATDQVGQGEDVTTDQEATLAYLTLSHKLTPKLTGVLNASYQHGVFSGGDIDGSVDGYFSTSLSFDYRMSHHWAAQLSYHWDRLESDLEFRSYSRNRFYVGVRATY